MVNIDPSGPKFHIQKFDPGEARPQPRTFFQCPDFLITRTYCLLSDHVPGYPHGLRIQNKVFSDADGQVLRHWHIETRELDDDGAEMSKLWAERLLAKGPTMGIWWPQARGNQRTGQETYFAKASPTTSKIAWTHRDWTPHVQSRSSPPEGSQQKETPKPSVAMSIFFLLWIVDFLFVIIYQRVAPSIPVSQKNIMRQLKAKRNHSRVGKTYTA